HALDGWKQCVACLAESLGRRVVRTGPFALIRPYREGRSFIALLSLHSCRLDLLCRGCSRLLFSVRADAAVTTRPNHALQRTRPSRHCCNPRASWAGSLSLGR